MSYPTKAEREKCWAARDEFFACLDKNNGETDNVPNVCEQFKKVFEQVCPQQWVWKFVVIKLIYMSFFSLH